MELIALFISFRAPDTQKGGKKNPVLCEQFPSKSEGKELKIVVQPETQHRARYLTEGSRGSVKDRTQQGFPTVKLEGHNEPVVLQVFVGNDSGRVKPHGFYQACRVTGRNTTPCKEVDIEGTTVIEVMLDPSNMMTLAVDCVGILKLRNADVEARIGIAGSKKKSTRARLVFRVNIPRKDGSTLTLQTPSSPILCTQPAGVPEILKKSLHNCSVKGEEEMFLIGKNFLKGAKVVFQENLADDSSWKAEAEIDMELFHQNHLIVKVPPYHDQNITSPVSVVMFVVTNAGRSHEVQPFTYTPDSATVTSPVCNIDQVNLLPPSRGSPVKSSGIIKNEDVAPMELTGDQRASPLYKTSNIVVSAQQNLENSSPSGSFSPSVSHLPTETDQQTLFTQESLSTIQTQDIAQPSNFQASPSSHNEDAIMQQTTSFQSMEAQPRDTLQSDRALVTLSQMAEATQQSHEPALQEQAQTLQQQISTGLFPQSNNVGQMQNTIHQLQSGNFQSNVSNNNNDVDLVQQVLEAQQQLSCVLFSGQGSNENEQSAIGQVQEQINAGIFQPVGSIQNQAGQGMFSSSDQVHSRSENVLSARSDSLLQQAENAMSSQQQAMETNASLVMEMQQSIHQSQGSIQSDIFQAQSPSSGAIQSPVFQHQQGTHLMSGLSASEEMQMQCDMFSSPGVTGNDGSGGQQQVSATNSNMFQSSSSADGNGTSTQPEQMQNSVFPNMVQMQHGGDGQSQVDLFSSAEEMLGVQTGGGQQQGSGLFQQAGDMMGLQTGNFLQQSPHSHTQLYHSQNTIGDNQSMAQETQGSLFHPQGSMVQHQNSTSAQDQIQSSLYHLQGTISASSEQQPNNMFSMSSLQSNQVPQEKQLSFFSSQNSLPEQQSAFQQQTQLSHIQNSMLTQEQQQQSQQNLFQAQNQQNSLFQATHSMVGMQSSPSPHEQNQNLLFSAQSSMANMASSEQQQSMMFSQSQEPMTTQDQQNQAMFHSQSMEFQAQSPVTSQHEQQQAPMFSPVSSQHEQQQAPMFSPVSSQHEQQQAPMFHNSPQLQLVQPSSTSQEQQVTLFMSSASMSALQNNMSQQELQQTSLFPQSIQGSTPPPQQQNSMFHSPAGGAMSQMQSASASSPQATEMFLFGIQNTCAQLISPASGQMPDQMMALSQPGQSQGDGQSVTSLLSRQNSSMANDQNMEKISNLLVSLHNQGNGMSGSY